MEKIFTACTSERTTTIGKHNTEKIRSFSAIKSIFLAITFLCLGSMIANAQCNSGPAPYLCFDNAPAASGITSTTADISAVTSRTTYYWVTQAGFVWSTSPAPTTASPGISSSTFGTGTMQIPTYGPITITGLLPGTTYYLRPFDVGNGTTTIYGTQISFTTPSAGPINMTTTTPTSITGTTASTGGTVTIVSGTPTIVERGVVYSIAANPTTGSGTKLIDPSPGTGSFVSNLTGLSSSTTYHVRSYSIDNLGNIYYGSDVSFTTPFQVSGVVSPFSLTPDWYFGQGARYTFPSGSFPSVPPGPTISSIGTNNSVGVETSTGVSFRNGSIAMYTNTMQAYNGGETGPWSTNIRNFTGESPVTTCGGSAAAGGVAFPDPANDATNDAFYMIIANDLTSGGCANHGMHRYRFTGTGTSVAYNAGPLLLAADDSSSEGLVAGTDGSGGYWVVSHDKRATNNFYVWHFTSAGMSAPVRYTPATAATITATPAGYLKFSPCMNKIAFAGFGGAISVYNFNRVTGAVGTEVATKAVGSAVYSGLEFSPDSTKMYYSGQGTIVNWFSIASPATGGSVTGSSSWTMQMGPDQQIYTSGNYLVAPGTTTGVITNANSSSPGFSPMTLTGGGTVFRGINNIAWLSPQTPKINSVVTNCTVDFSSTFKNYFNDNVTIKTGSYSWDFGDASALGTGATPTHTYPSGTNSYTVTLTFRDSCCNQLWTVTAPVSTSCTVLPVDLISFKGHKEPEGNVLYWATSSETNNNYFEILKSDDGVNFYSIGKVNANSQPSGISNYDFTDIENNGKSVSYYRLAQYDNDGKVTYSNVISIRTALAVPTISPNPSSSSFMISMPYEKSAVITVMDVLGKVLEKKTMEENIPFVVIGDTLSKGSYVVSVTTDTENYFFKIIKE